MAIVRVEGHERLLRGNEASSGRVPCLGTNRLRAVTHRDTECRRATVVGSRWQRLKRTRAPSLGSRFPIAIRADGGKLVKKTIRSMYHERLVLRNCWCWVCCPSGRPSRGTESAFALRQSDDIYHKRVVVVNGEACSRNFNSEEEADAYFDEGKGNGYSCYYQAMNNKHRQFSSRPSRVVLPQLGHGVLQLRPRPSSHCHAPNPPRSTQGRPLLEAGPVGRVAPIAPLSGCRHRTEALAAAWPAAT